MHTEILRYDADGVSMESHVFVGAGADARRPGVLVFPEAFGLGDHAKARARRLAEAGYVALACDYYGDGRCLGSLDAVMAEIGPLAAAPERIRARARGGLEALAARPEVDPARIAAIGYCFGGTTALELARDGAEILGAVGFHSGLKTARPNDAGQIKGKVLVCLGADDPGIDADQRRAFEEEMRQGDVNWQMTLYGGVVHSFTNPDADALGRPEFARYDAQADARSWREMLTFFDEIFGSVTPA